MRAALAGAGRYVLNVAIAADQLANALAFGNPDETISSRAAKAREAGRRWGCVLCWILDRIHRDHCARSIERDEA